MEDLIRTYGYWGLLLWSCVGGEEGILLAGTLAGHQYLSLRGIIIAAAIGGSLGDHIFFYLARWRGFRFLDRNPKLRRRYARAAPLVSRYGSMATLASRFMVGFRISLALACGAVGMSPLTYSTLNVLSAFLWASLYGSLAYHLGPALPAQVSRLWQGIGWGLLAATMAIILWLYLSRHAKARFHRNDSH